ncbi:DUF4266 domain-containing protein [Bermanella marisrubri]|uniref:DUF4266 domain-containing protein n=1 Tax=Bermanella marisrubri TaxID=207949 RepID=Q1N0V6_9GAMM|nr:DUF4266 domain-containing protein [Bermanella marisrubri]EAT11918.1 hypothetical protein RED65_14192 [Oceanobacter sp. RED65] [Bermanella marisrubri]QIZ83006.1 DUF4266 domain-containing protein [Bermanella marisrubri]
MLKAVAMTLLALFISACSTIEPMFDSQPVKPWEKGILAKPQMDIGGDPIDKYVDDHIYYSKEGSTGGTGVGGGGCGCN